ncbi:MAG: glycosyltransferase family 2 protein [Candidatus Cryptobacteroides sp.]
MRVAVVILNWNTKDFLKSFVPGVLASLGREDSLYVADSGSTDGSLELLERDFPEVKRLPLGENLGFTGGYNKALSQIDAQYYLLLNSDIEVEQDWLEPLVQLMEEKPECGICAPKLLALERGERGDWHKTKRFEYAGAAGGLLDFFGYPYCRGRVLSHVDMDTGQFDQPSRVFWASGAAMLIRSSLWKRLGGFDSRFFAHMEEIDLCWRAQGLGFQVWVQPRSVVYHIGGGTLPSTSPMKLRLNFRNSLWMLKKNLPAAIGPFRASCRIAFRYVLDWGSALVYLLSGKKAYAQAVFQAHKEYKSVKTEPFKASVKVKPGSGLIFFVRLFGIR